MRSSSASDADLVSFEQLRPPAPPVPSVPERSPEQVAAEANATIAAARAEAERLLAAAQARGLEQGYEAGIREARERLEPAAGALAQAQAELERLREGELERLERHAAELSLQIAEKVIAGALAVQPERVLDVVAGGLRCLVDRDRATILVNPQDLELVRGAVEGLVNKLGGFEHLEVQEERRVGPGGAVVRALGGEVDARLESKLERVREVVEGALGG